MSTELTGPEQVTTALMALVANAGNVAKTCRDLGDDAPAQATLRKWSQDTHAEQYRRLEKDYGEQLEQMAVAQARQMVVKAGEIEAQLLDEMGGMPREMKPQALRAVADSKAKNIDKMLALTGRPVAPKSNDGGDIVKLMQSMVDKGWLKMAAGVELEPAKADERG